MTFDCGFSEDVDPGQSFEDPIGSALASGSFHLEYQPQISVRDGGPCGAEALVRWDPPAVGTPGCFPVSGGYDGLVDRIARWRLDEACRLASEAAASGLASFRLALGLSPLELFAPDLVGRLGATFARFGASPASLELDIAASAVTADLGRAFSVLERLRALGVAVALDGFGRGTSSFAPLKRLPVHTLRLDRGLVAEIDRSSVDRNIVQAIVSLGHDLGLEVAAVGIERRPQADAVAGLGVDVVQGSHYGRSMDGAFLLSWLGRALPFTNDHSQRDTP